MDARVTGLVSLWTAGSQPKEVTSLPRGEGPGLKASRPGVSPIFHGGAIRESPPPLSLVLVPDFERTTDFSQI